jgi:hypothetical protein
MRAGAYDAWRSTPLKAVEDAGQQEVRRGLSRAEP